jgi:hypothetical protein
VSETPDGGIDVIQSTQLLADDQFIPADDDWAEFVAYCEEQDAAQANLDQLPDVEPSAEQWAVHVRDYLAANHLTAIPF